MGSHTQRAIFCHSIAKYVCIELNLFFSKKIPNDIPVALLQVPQNGVLELETVSSTDYEWSYVKDKQITLGCLAWIISYCDLINLII